MPRFAPFALSLAVAATLAAPAMALADDQRLPDIIVVMVDDLGAIDERILERLPSIRELWLEGGLRFDAAYGETPLCCPGRASFLTGQHTSHHHVYTNSSVLDFDPSVTLATALDDAGYETLLVGKYMNQSYQLADKTPPGWDRVAMMVFDHGTTSWTIDDVDIGPAPYDDLFVSDFATEWLDETPSNRPAFLLAAPRAPHGTGSAAPWTPHISEAYLTDGRCTGIEPWRPPSYALDVQPDGFPLDDVCRSLLTIDDMVGELRTIAQRRGRPTVWMFTSDNGMAWGQHGFPLKNVPWSTQLPLYFAGAGVAAGSTAALVSNIDFAPTLAELAGTTVPGADGVSFASVLAGGAPVRTRLLENHPAGGFTSGPWTSGWWGVRTRRWHLIKIGTEPMVLYDGLADPWDMTDVRAEHRRVVKKLRLWAYPLR